MVQETSPDAIRPFNPVHVQDDLDAKKFRTSDLEIAIRQALDPTYVDEFPPFEDMLQQSKEKVTLKNQANVRERKRKASNEISEIGKKKVSNHGGILKHEADAYKPTVISGSVHGKHKASPVYRKIYHLRHKLQQLVYNKKKGEIAINDYVKILDVIKEIEKVDVSYVYLRDSKISKIVKAAHFYPFETEVEIKERCQELIRGWKYKFIELHSKANPVDH